MEPEEARAALDHLVQEWERQAEDPQEWAPRILRLPVAVRQMLYAALIECERADDVRLDVRMTADAAKEAVLTITRKPPAFLRELPDVLGGGEP